MSQASVINQVDVSTDDDFDFDAELYARDPVFDRATQKELVRRARDMEAGRNIVSKTWEELKALEND